jgi:hypothetical protein
MKKLAKLSIFCVILIVLILIHNVFSPPDWVELRLEQVPSDLEQVYVLVRDNDKISFLKSYHSKVFPDVSKDGAMWRPGNAPQLKDNVQWSVGDSYGILAQRKSGEWVVWWIGPRDISGPSPLRFVIGGGTVSMRTSGIESAIPAPKSLVNQVNY